MTAARTVRVDLARACGGEHTAASGRRGCRRAAGPGGRWPRLWHRRAEAQAAAARSEAERAAVEEQAAQRWPRAEWQQTEALRVAAESTDRRQPAGTFHHFSITLHL